MQPKISPKRVAILAALTLLPVSAFAAATGTDGGLFAALCSSLCGGGCCG
ncbi:MAG: hypothetical protein H6737_14065 [Alphaproteobacteria bacterium]|nr:hypothetical protein [Alphaproteobacteria bacterium]